LKRKGSTPIMKEVNNDILTMIETIVGTLMVNPIRMIIKRKNIKEMEAFIKREF